MQVFKGRQPRGAATRDAAGENGLKDGDEVNVTSADSRTTGRPADRSEP
jgi:hypothetical protein